MIIVNGFQPLTIITKCSILDVAAVVDPSLILDSLVQLLRSNINLAYNRRKIHFIAIPFEDSRRLGIDFYLKISVCGTTLSCHFFHEIFSVNKYFDDFYLSKISGEFLHLDKFNIRPYSSEVYLFVTVRQRGARCLL